jgi:radical SAM family uncharacterized protein
MENISKTLEELLPYVQTPAQYIGGETNSIVKDPRSVEVSFALAFPDMYTVGMSHLGLQVLYSILNKRPDVAAERVFSPWPDMEARMRGRKLALFSLETRRPIREFDIVGFSLQYEICYAEMLRLLALAGIPLLSSERTEKDPLIVAGGPCAFNPEPVADFVDVFLVGDCEATIHALVDAFRAARKEGASRKGMLRRLATAHNSFYVPSLYEHTYNADGAIAAITALDGAPPMITKAIVQNLDDAPAPTAPVVPYVEIIHDRITIEIMRGCPGGCRFCQAARIKRPLRARSVENILALARETYKNTGYDEIALVSLSSSDYPDFTNLLAKITAEFSPLSVNVSLPSLRVTEHLKDLPQYLSQVRKSGLTLAPEAATDTLRRTLGKHLSNEDLFAAAVEAYRQGWDLVKLYFMIGLPEETKEDIDAIADMAAEVSRLRRQANKGPARVNVSVSTFVPKPFTPLERARMIDIERTREIQRYLRQKNRSNKIALRFHNAERSFLEGVFSRGDRRLGRVLMAAHRNGCKLDTWDEMFRFDLWKRAFAESGVDPDFYAMRERSPEEILPWSFIAHD